VKIVCGVNLINKGLFYKLIGFKLCFIELFYFEYKLCSLKLGGIVKSYGYKVCFAYLVAVSAAFSSAKGEGRAHFFGIKA
jgi:hypothetical protein